MDTGKYHQIQQLLFLKMFIKNFRININKLCCSKGNKANVQAKLILTEMHQIIKEIKKFMVRQNRCQKISRCWYLQPNLGIAKFHAQKSSSAKHSL